MSRFVMKSSTRFLFVPVALALVSILAGCRDKNGDDRGTLEPQSELQQLLASAGKIITEPERYTKRAIDTSIEKNVTHRIAIEDVTFQAEKITHKFSVDFLENSQEFTLLNPWAGVLWPGALIRGGTLHGTKIPTAIPIVSKRKPHQIVFSALTGDVSAGDETTWAMETPMNEGDVQTTQNKLLSQFVKNGAASVTHYEYFEVHNKEEMLHRAGLNIDAFGVDLDAKFKINWGDKKNRIMVKLFQRFFTMSCPAFDMGPIGAFTDDITVDELKNYTGPGDPICYVSSVTYGRVYYLLYETSEDLKSLQLLVDASYSDKVAASYKLNTDKILKNTKITLLQYGGDQAGGLAVALNPTKAELDKFLTDGSRFYPANTAMPISFEVKHLVDNSPVLMRNTLSYTYDNVTYVDPSSNRIQPTQFIYTGVTIEPMVVNGYKLSNETIFTVEADLYVSDLNPQPEIAHEKVQMGSFISVPSKVRIPFFYRTKKFDNIPNPARFEFHLRGNIKAVTYKDKPFTSKDPHNVSFNEVFIMDLINEQWVSNTPNQVFTDGYFMVTTRRCTFKITPHFTIWYRNQRITPDMIQ